MRLRSHAAAWAPATTSSNLRSASPASGDARPIDRAAPPPRALRTHQRLLQHSQPQLARSFAVRPSPTNSGRSTPLSPSLPKIWPLLLMVVFLAEVSGGNQTSLETASIEVIHEFVTNFRRPGGPSGLT
jgi:hypothetical protein